jgi:ClpP class serine protease
MADKHKAAESASLGSDENVPDPALESAPAAGPSSSPPPPWVQLIQLRATDPTEDEIKRLVHQQMEEELASEPLAEQYNILFLYDASTLMRSDTDRVYRAVASLKEQKPLLLIVDSGGGDIAAAYFIAKLCREYSRERFEVVVPRRAKSAATLLCCGADRIHMGSLSELGPIDPQFEGVPALALKYSIEHLAELTKRYPGANALFADYLARSLRIEALGYYERVAESAAQYAERLLKSRRSLEQDASEMARIAHHLVYAYKDHGFVIDAAEAAETFGDDVVKVNTPEYDLGNKLYRSLDLLEWVLGDFYERHFSFTGTAGSGAFVPRKSPRK